MSRKKWAKWQENLKNPRKYAFSGDLLNYPPPRNGRNVTLSLFFSILSMEEILSFTATKIESSGKGRSGYLFFMWSNTSTTRVSLERGIRIWSVRACALWRPRKVTNTYIESILIPKSLDHTPWDQIVVPKIRNPNIEIAEIKEFRDSGILEVQG